jgi:REP element-mobilizing transposase RayT
MGATIGYHLVKTCYGRWLPGDERGHWSSAWDEQIGYLEPHRLHAGDPVRKRMAAELMKHSATLLNESMIAAVAEAVSACAAESDWRVAALAIEPTHMHLLLTPTSRDMDRTAKWIAQQTTKAVHQRTPYGGPVWSDGKWLAHVFELGHWTHARRYIERHNERRGLPARPWEWIAA